MKGQTFALLSMFLCKGLVVSQRAGICMSEDRNYIAASYLRKCLKTLANGCALVRKFGELDEMYSTYTPNPDLYC